MNYFLKNKKKVTQNEFSIVILISREESNPLDSFLSYNLLKPPRLTKTVSLLFFGIACAIYKVEFENNKKFIDFFYKIG